MRPNPKRPAKPLWIVAKDSAAKLFELFAYAGGRKKVGFVQVLRVRNKYAKYVAEELGDASMPTWYVHVISLKPHLHGKGYGQQLYATAFAECVRRSNGPCVIGAEETMTTYGETSDMAKASWLRLKQDFRSPESAETFAVLMRPEDVEWWMRPDEYVGPEDTDHKRLEYKP